MERAVTSLLRPALLERYKEIESLSEERRRVSATTQLAIKEKLAIVVNEFYYCLKICKDYVQKEEILEYLKELRHTPAA